MCISTEDVAAWWARQRTKAGEDWPQSWGLGGSQATAAPAKARAQVLFPRVTQGEMV